jgi:hypothetical protein
MPLYTIPICTFKLWQIQQVHLLLLLLFSAILQLEGRPFMQKGYFELFVVKWNTGIY